MKTFDAMTDTLEISIYYDRLRTLRDIRNRYKALKDYRAADVLKGYINAIEKAIDDQVETLKRGNHES